MKRILAILLGTACLLAAGTVTAYAQAYEPVPVTISKDKVKIGGKMYYSHIVLERQTLYSISKAYGVTIKEITDMNPAISADGSGLTKNSIILIPVKEAEEQPAATKDAQPQEQQSQQPAEYRTHTVKWYENIDDIASLYGVSVKSIMEANGLTSKALTSRQVLRIPLRNATPAPAPAENNNEPEAVQPVETVATEVTVVETEPEKIDTVIVPPYTGTDKVSMTLLLALNTRNGGFSSINMDFYSGVLMAMKELEAEGISTELHVFDVAGGKLPPLDSLKLGNFILGPCAPQDIENVLAVVGDSIPVISPMDPKAAGLSAKHPNVYHAASNNDFQFAEMAAWIKKNQNEKTKVAVLVNRAAPGGYPAKIKEELEKAGLVYTVIQDRGTLLTTLRKGKYTDIVIASEDETYMTDILTILGSYSREAAFNSYAFEKVLKMKEIDTDLFYPARLHVTTAYYTDENDPLLNRFYNRYLDVFQFEPNQFAMQGYDTAYFFIKLYSVYGEKWAEYAPEFNMHLSHSDIHLERTENGALVNTEVRRVIHNMDMSITTETP